jgi:hypothetical protein
MDEKAPKLYRRRYMPDECVFLKDDEILYIDEKIILTQWKTLKPRPDFDHGCSCYYLDEGFKISRFFDKNDQFLYYYCDVIETHYRAEDNSYIFNDLLADVVIYDNGFVEVLDIGEIADAVENNIITPAQMIRALKILDKLLNIIYTGKLTTLAEPLHALQRV